MLFPLHNKDCNSFLQGKANPGRFYSCRQKVIAWQGRCRKVRFTGPQTKITPQPGGWAAGQKFLSRRF